MNWDSVVERVGVGMWRVMDFTGVIGEGLSEGAMFELILRRQPFSISGEETSSKRSRMCNAPEISMSLACQG